MGKVAFHASDTGRWVRLGKVWVILNYRDENTTPLPNYPDFDTPLLTRIAYGLYSVGKGQVHVSKSGYPSLGKARLRAVGSVLEAHTPPTSCSNGGPP